MNSPALPKAVERLLGAVGSEPPFLGPQHGQAASRLMHCFERARLTQRVTMSYDPARIGGQRGSAGPAEITDSATDARKRLAALADAMPRDCWGVLFDVCGHDLGLQEIEAARNWPRRSAKLVLRVALEQLAAHYGLEAAGRGGGTGPQRGWLEQRPKMFEDET
ncbi:MAG: hypothetical protein IR164_18450 [Devosia sp.]|uniref:DUF6456 domain-containing protein n=1 Tax=Devosia sp. TaxID=1871048 RepID=UPI0019ED40FD|nr:DUF6456 domain-containing protein [Devosia sp.]MBF0680912.1 hypothetical protein [Devosia sp.]